MDINQVKLKRLVDHIEDDGSLTPKSVADILKAKVENTNFLREYVKAAAGQLKQPELIEQFEVAITADAAPVVTPAAKTEAPVEGEIQSKPEAPAPRTPAKMPVQTAPTPAFVEDAPMAVAIVTPTRLTDAPATATGSADAPPHSYRYRDANGVSRNLQVVHVGKTGVVLLEDAPVDEIVEVVLRGEKATLNLTQLRALPGGDMHLVNGGSYMVATLLVIADAAKA